MAVQGKMMANVGSDLDSLIHSLEYENQQYVKMIERENQRNQYLELQEEEKMGMITELQTQVTNLERDTKNNHKQLVHNKNTLESLKRTKSVLQAHIDALYKQLDTLRFENDEQQREFEGTVQMYEKTWTEYQAVYKSMPLYKTLQEAEDRLAQSEAERCKWLQQKTELQRKLQAAQDELDFRDWHRFCIKISERKLSLARMKNELLAAVREKETLQAKLKEIREKNTSTAESSQTMDTDDAGMSSSKKDAGEDSAAEGDDTLVEGDGGDASVALMQKEELPGDRTHGSTQNQPRTSQHDGTFTVNNAADSRLPTVVPFSAIDAEQTQEAPLARTLDFAHSHGFQPPSASTPVVSGAKSSSKQQLPQLTSTPKMPRPPLAVAVPKINQRPGVAQSSLRPRQVPLINVPRLSSKSAPPKVPSVQHAVSSILSSAKPEAEKNPKPPLPPVMPKVVMPSVPIICPPPSSIPSPRVPHHSETSRTSWDMSRGEMSKVTTLLVPPGPTPVLAAPRLSSHAAGREQGRGSVAKPVMPAPPSPVVVMPSVNRLPQVLRPTDRACPPLMKSALPAPSPRTPVGAASAAGDAPSQCSTGKSSCPSSHDSGELSDDTASHSKGDEDMELDTESQDGSQPMSTSDKVSLASSQGQSSDPMSPFDMQKHQQKLMELRQLEDSDYNPFQQPNSNCNNVHQSSDPVNNDGMVTGTTKGSNVTESTSAIFNTGFAVPSEPAQRSAAPLFSNSSAQSPGNNVKLSSPSREERSGSFFSFESMDTNENTGGLTLLSLFGTPSKEPEPEQAFSFSFGGSAVNSGTDSGFSFSFPGEGGSREATSGSIFSLF